MENQVEITNLEESEDVLYFQIANKAVTHLGRNLYQSTPPAVAELIANSYDAYAKLCNVTINEKSIIVADNGIGMSYDDFKERYVQIGQEKLPVEVPEGMDKRPSMGKKGIGKLASFSVGSKFMIYSKTQEMEKWLKITLNYNDILNSPDPNKFKANCCYIEEEPEHAIVNTNGFIVEIVDLKRKITSASESGIISRLSRRFYLDSEKYDFSVELNSLPLEFQSNYYYENIEVMMTINGNLDAMKKKFSKMNPDNIFNSNTDWSNLPNVKGWIASVEKPSNLKSEDESSAGVILYINGKIADEGLLKNKPDARLANNYIVGELHADFLAEVGDPITSSRQGLDRDNTTVVEIIKKLVLTRDEFILKWDSFREKEVINKLPKLLNENEMYHNWYNNLDEERSRLADKILSVVQVSTEEMTDEKAVLRLYAAGVNLIEDNKIEATIDSINEAPRDLLVKIMSEALSKMSTVESLKHKAIIRTRLAAIDKLVKLIEDKTIEDLFEKHLYEHPWLINPYWNKTQKDSKTIELETQKYVKHYSNVVEKKKDTNEPYGFIDIFVCVAENERNGRPIPIIVELKRSDSTSYSNVDRFDIAKQIEGYRSMIISEFKSKYDIDIEKNELEAFFIGEMHSKIKDDDRKHLREVERINVLTYSEIISRARMLYAEHLKSIEEIDYLSFIDDIFKELEKNED